MSSHKGNRKRLGPPRDDRVTEGTETAPQGLPPKPRAGRILSTRYLHRPYWNTWVFLRSARPSEVHLPAAPEWPIVALDSDDTDAYGFECSIRGGFLGSPEMTTKLEGALKREVMIDGSPYTITIDPRGLKLVAKGKRKGYELEWVALISGDAALAAALTATLANAPDPLAVNRKPK
jgi:hypothetical protein